MGLEEQGATWELGRTRALGGGKLLALGHLSSVHWAVEVKWAGDYHLGGSQTARGPYKGAAHGLESSKTAQILERAR